LDRGRFIAWDGYIHGILLGVDEGRRIVQTWRTSEFPPEFRDSRLVVEFEATRGGTRVVVRTATCRRARSSDTKKVGPSIT